MKNDVVPVQIRGILPANTGCAIFVGNDEKVFVIQVEHNLGAVIGMFLRDQPKERPLTHDLMVHVFKGFGITVERVIITELRNSTYFARLILRQQNELGTKLVEIDARPSDCLALAAAHKRPVFVAKPLFDQDRERFRQFLTAQANVRSLSAAMLIGPDTTIIEKADTKTDQHGVSVVVDKKSELWLDGTTVEQYARLLESPEARQRLRALLANLFLPRNNLLRPISSFPAISRPI